MLPAYSGRPPLGLRTDSIPKPGSDTEPAVAPLFQYLRMHSPLRTKVGVGHLLAAMPACGRGERSPLSPEGSA